MRFNIRAALKTAAPVVFGLALLVSAFAWTASKSGAQTPNTFGPYNTDLGALITNTARAPGTVTSSQQTNVDKRGVVCTFLQSSVSGSPSITFAIQGYDAATNSYNTLATSSTITTSTTNIYTVTVYPGAVTGDAPSNGVVKGLPLPAKWRLSQTIANANTTTTGVIGCNSLK